PVFHMVSSSRVRSASDRLSSGAPPEMPRSEVVHVAGGGVTGGAQAAVLTTIPAASTPVADRTRREILTAIPSSGLVRVPGRAVETPIGDEHLSCHTGSQQ